MARIRQAFQAGLNAMKAYRSTGPTEIVLPPRHESKPDLQSSPAPPRP